LRGLEVRAKRGRLIDARGVEKHTYELVRALREQFLNWPATVSGRLATAMGVDPARLEIALEAEVRTFLSRATAERLSGAVHAA
jgi:hypothetical protein